MEQTPDLMPSLLFHRCALMAQEPPLAQVRSPFLTDELRGDDDTD